MQTWISTQGNAALARELTVSAAERTQAIAAAAADNTFALTQKNAQVWQTVSIAASVAGDAQAHITEETDREVIGWQDYATYAQASANADAVRGAAAAQAAASFKTGMAAADLNYMTTVAPAVAQKHWQDAVAQKMVNVANSVSVYQANLQSMQQQLLSDQAKPASAFGTVIAQALPISTIWTDLAKAWKSDGVAGVFNWAGDLLTDGMWSAAVASPQFGQVLNAVDGLFAGFSHALTAGLTTRLRTLIYGDLQQNHQGVWFNVGVALGTVANIILMANPCAMGVIAKYGLNGLEAIGGAWNAVTNIAGKNFLSAGLDILGVLGNVMGKMGTVHLCRWYHDTYEIIRPYSWREAWPAYTRSKCPLQAAPLGVSYASQCPAQRVDHSSVLPCSQPGPRPRNRLPR